MGSQMVAKQWNTQPEVGDEGELGRWQMEFCGSPGVLGKAEDHLQGKHRHHVHGVADSTRAQQSDAWLPLPFPRPESERTNPTSSCAES